MFWCKQPADKRKTDLSAMGMAAQHERYAGGAIERQQMRPMGKQHSAAAARLKVQFFQYPPVQRASSAVSKTLFRGGYIRKSDHRKRFPVPV